MSDLSSPRVIMLKGLLFLLAGLISAGLLIAEHPTWKVILLLLISIWSFARFYYFAFYVIEKYIDAEYRFSGLFDFLKYLLFQRKSNNRSSRNRTDNSASK